jgi:hypothetical protein
VCVVAPLPAPILLVNNVPVDEGTFSPTAVAA